MPWVPVHQTVLSMYLHLSQLRKAFKHVIKSYLCWWDLSKNFKLNTCQNALLSWEGLLDASCRVHLDFPLGACGYDGRSQVCRSNLLTTHSLSIPGAAKPAIYQFGGFLALHPFCLGPGEIQSCDWASIAVARRRASAGHHPVTCGDTRGFPNIGLTVGLLP